MVGTVSVGKTSLTARFLSNTFSSVYLPTIGVRVGSRTVEVNGKQVKLVVWDIEGTNELTTTTAGYLLGAGGIVYVADGTRKATFLQIQQLREKVVSQMGERPSVLLVNKSDLTDDWEVLMTELESSALGNAPSFVTSAKTGSGVEVAFLELAAGLIGT